MGLYFFLAGAKVMDFFESAMDKFKFVIERN
jgi:hypothetical protein